MENLVECSVGECVSGKKLHKLHAPSEELVVEDQGLCKSR